MTTLEDILISLSSQILNAKISLDNQSKDIALGYMKDPILRHFQVPRLEIDDVNITLIGSVITNNSSFKDDNNQINKFIFDVARIEKVSAETNEEIQHLSQKEIFFNIDNYIDKVIELILKDPYTKKNMADKLITKIKKNAKIKFPVSKLASSYIFDFDTESVLSKVGNSELKEAPLMKIDIRFSLTGEEVNISELFEE